MSASSETVRLEIAFGGPQHLSVVVPVETADELDKALQGSAGSWSFEADDGRYTVQLASVVYVRRFARESRVGFGATG